MNNSPILLSIVVSIFLSGCGMVKGKKDAEKRATEFMNDRITNGGIGGNAFYSPEFWKVTSKEKWENYNEILAKANGDLASFSIKNWKINYSKNLNGLSGTFVIVVFETQYETGSGRERVTFHRKKKTDKFTIIGHDVASPEMKKLIQKGVENAANSIEIEKRKD